MHSFVWYCWYLAWCSRKKVDMFNHRCEKPWVFYSNMSGGHHPMVRHHPSTPKSHRGSAPRLGFSKPRKLLGVKTEFQPPMRRPQVFQCLSESLLTMWDITTGWWLTYPSEKIWVKVSWDDEVPNVPNHQPVRAYMAFIYKHVGL
jgi:hypothetical protein